MLASEGGSCPDVLCIQEHHITGDGLDGAKNLTRNVGYAGRWGPAVSPATGGTKGGAAVLVRSHVTAFVISYPGTSPVPMAGTGRVTACHFAADQREHPS